jgi:NTE family protein
MHPGTVSRVSPSPAAFEDHDTEVVAAAPGVTVDVWPVEARAAAPGSDISRRRWEAMTGMPGIREADAVFQGGGVKGLGLIGALLEFADRGWDTWVSVAGTSAGAIVAAYLACGHSPEEAETLLRTTPYDSFQDWGRGGEILGGGWNLIRHHGLARGEAFRTWFDEQVNGATFAEVCGEDGCSRLKLIAADVTRQEMLVLPDDLSNYDAPGTGQRIEPLAFRVADAVRMSMSIPYFFQPVELVHHDTRRASTIVDGGVLSNFPVWLFDVDHEARRPTFGFRLRGGRSVGDGLEHVVDSLGWPVELGVSIFHTACDAWDKRFMSHSSTVRSFAIDAGDVGTTDFGITPAEQDWLVSSGRRCAAEFLDGFRPENYMNTFGHGLAPQTAAAPG